MLPHEQYMRMAINEARKAAAIDEVPVGAVIVSASGEILGAAHNRTINDRVPTSHAEIAEVVNSIPGRRVYFISGYFYILKMRINGHMVMELLYSASRGENRASVDSTTTCYIRVNSILAGLLTKLAAFLFPKKVDERIGRFANAVRTVAIAVHNDPAGAYAKLAASGEVSPAELKEFAGMFL